jgi:hypothetical protein
VARPVYGGSGYHPVVRASRDVAMPDTMRTQLLRRLKLDRVPLVP